MRLPSAGKVGLFVKCIGSAILPQVKQESGFTPEAEEGNRKHAVVEAFFRANRSTAKIEEKDHELCRRVAATVGPTPTSGERPEVKYLVTVGSEEASDRFDILPDDAEPGDDLRESAFYGIADYLGYDEVNNVAHIYDFKSGSFFVDKPEWNWQLILPALGIWIAGGKSETFKVVAGIVHIRDDAHVGEGYRCERQTIGVETLRHRLDWLRRVVAKCRVARPESVTLYEGKHCQYCPARARCPAKIGALGFALERYGSNFQWLGKGKDTIIAAVSMVESKPQLDKAAKELIKMNGLKVETNGKTEYEYDLGDGRTAVVSIDAKGKEKLFTRKVHKQDSMGVEGAE